MAFDGIETHGHSSQANSAMNPDLRLNNSWIKRGALMGALAVVFGAFGAHGLGGYLTEKYASQTRTVLGEEIPAARKYLGDFKTAATYQMTHALALVATGTVMALRPRRWLRVAAPCFLWGTILFSGSLYLLVLTGQSWLGAVTPLGGLLLIAGWVALVEGACPGRTPPQPASDNGTDVT